MLLDFSIRQLADLRGLSQHNKRLQGSQRTVPKKREYPASGSCAAEGKKPCRCQRSEWADLLDADNQSRQNSIYDRQP